MSPNAKMPEPGIDNFGDFVIAHNKNARIMVQSSWSAYDGHGSTPSVGGTGGGNFKNADRDSEKLETVKGWLANEKSPTGYLPKLRAQLEGIDKRAGRQITYVVPSSTAVAVLDRGLHAALGGDRREDPGRDQAVRTHSRSDRPPDNGSGASCRLRLVFGDVPEKPGRPAGAGRQGRPYLGQAGKDAAADRLERRRRRAEERREGQDGCGRELRL
jgi:hypothetical protein